jgi:uncharacterized lipoprotein YmbA
MLSSCSHKAAFNKIHYYQFYGQNNKLSITKKDDNAILVISDIVLPSSLNNRGIAMRISKQQFQNANWHQWNSAPDEMLLSITQGNLASLETNWLVLTKSTPHISLIAKKHAFYEVKWTLTRFNGGLNNNAEIAGMWQIFKHQTDGDISIVHQEYFTEQTTLTKDGYQALVGALEITWLKINKDFMLALENITKLDD